MASLGSFGAAAREYDPGAERDDFEFFGETFVVHQEIPAMIELTITAALAGKATGQQGDAAMWEALRIALTIPAHTADGKTVPANDEQWDRFYALAVRRGASSEDLSRLALSIAGFQIGRPTEQRPTSSDGSLPTSTSSNSSSSATPDSPTSSPAGEGSAG